MEPIEVIMKTSARRTILLGLLLTVPASFLMGQGSPAGFSGGSQPQPSTTSSPAKSRSASSAKQNNDSYVIGDADVLSINVWNEKDLSRSIPVRSDGKISLPLVGEIQAAGRTPLQLGRDISAILRSYITEPEVTVIVEQMNSEKFNILGQVVKPGSYSLAVANTIMNAIATAGGFRDFAKKKNIYILRENSKGDKLHIRFNYNDFIKGKNSVQDVKLEPNDTIIVP